MDGSDVLMLTGTLALCPDCEEERVLVPVQGHEFCCTSCDAAVLVLDVVAGRRMSGRKAS